MSWSRDQCELLIDEYQKHPCLYAVKSLSYRNKHARAAAFESIAKCLKQLKSLVTISEIKQKLSGLRGNFMTEHRKCMNSQTSGAGEEEVAVIF